MRGFSNNLLCLIVMVVATKLVEGSIIAATSAPSTTTIHFSQLPAKTLMSSSSLSVSKPSQVFLGTKTSQHDPLLDQRLSAENYTQPTTFITITSATSQTAISSTTSSASFQISSFTSGADDTDNDQPLDKNWQTNPLSMNSFPTRSLIKRYDRTAAIVGGTLGGIIGLVLLFFVVRFLVVVIGLSLAFRP